MISHCPSGSVPSTTPTGVTIISLGGALGPDTHGPGDHLAGFRITVGEQPAHDIGDALSRDPDPVVIPPASPVLPQQGPCTRCLRAWRTWANRWAGRLASNVPRPLSMSTHSVASRARCCRSRRSTPLSISLPSDQEHCPPTSSTVRTPSPHRRRSSKPSTAPASSSTPWRSHPGRRRSGRRNRRDRRYPLVHRPLTCSR